MPDNTIGWGQGSVNNDNGWGQGPANNALSWGMIGSSSYGHDETNLMGSNYQAVSAPQGMIINVPFAIEQSGNNYRIDPTFDIQERANITVTKTYYVDSVAGSDSNSGLTELLPLKTLTAVNAKGDYDRIFIKRGSIFQKNERVRQFTRNCEFIAYSTGNKPKITGRVNNQIGAYSPTDSYYSASASDFVAQVVDEANLDVNGNPTSYTQQASIADVNANAGSFFWSSSVIYIRTIDDRAPDADIVCSDSTSALVNTNNLTQYWENIEFERSAQFKTADNTGVNKQYFKNCNFYRGNYQFFGQTECILQDCDLWSYSDDVINIDNNPPAASGSAPCNVYEINLTGTNYKTGAGNSQISTTHHEANVIRINCDYQNAAGQIVADTGTGQSWDLGCTFNDSLAGDTFYCNNTTWMEGCNILGDAVSINVDTGGSLYYKNNILAGTVTETGIYAPYIENAKYLSYLSKATSETFTKPSTLQQYLGNRLIQEFDDAGVVLDGLLILAQDGSKDVSRVNLYNTSLLATLNGTLTYTSNQGLKGDGSTGYIDTNFNPSTDGGGYSQDDASIGMYVFTANAGATALSGWSIADSSLLVTNVDSTVLRINESSQSWTGTPTFSGTGLKLLSRVSSSQAYAWDGTTEYSGGTTSVALPNANINFLRRSGLVFGDSELAFVFWGASVRSKQAEIKAAIDKYLGDL